MKRHELTFSVKKAFGNLYRKTCVLIAVENNEGKILVGDKPYLFPPTITRLLGGGVDEGEDVRLAAARELKEELGVRVSPDELKPLVLFEVNATDEEGQTFHHETYVYHVNIGSQKYEAGDDIKDVVALTLDELDDLGERYDNLPEALWCNYRESAYSWADYAKMYGPVHHGVAQELKLVTKQ